MHITSRLPAPTTKEQLTGARLPPTEALQHLSSFSACVARFSLEALSATRRLVAWDSGERDLAQQHTTDAGCSLGEHSAALLGASIPHAHTADGYHHAIALSVT